MAQYLPPLNLLPIFNSDEFNYANDPISVSTGNGLYIKKTGADTAVGPLTLSNKLILPNGTSGLPSLTFSNSPTTGLYLIAANSVGISTNGINRFTIDTTSITSTLPYRTSYLGYPDAAYGNTINTQTGLYFGTATTTSIICNGSTKMLFGTSANTSFQPINGTDGTAAAPAYSFTTVQNAGLYYAGANQVAISSAGGQVAGFETGGMKLYNSSITGYTPSLLGFYHEATQNCTMTNGNNSQTLSVLFTRVGRLCHIRIPYFSTTNTNGSATTPTISFNVAPINAIYIYNTPVGYGGYFSLGVGYVSSTRTYLTAQLQGTNIYFFNQANINVLNNVQYEHLGSTITYIFT